MSMQDRQEAIRGFRERASSDPAYGDMFDIVNGRMRDWLESWPGPKPPTQYEILRQYAILCQQVANEIESGP